MKKIINYFQVFFLLFALIFADNLNSQSFQSLDFQCGGYVTGVSYTAGFNPVTNNFIIARTDIGGLYISSYNYSLNQRNDWEFVSQFARTPGALMVQGVAPYPNVSTPGTILIACGLSYLGSDAGKGIWKTTNGGINWSKKLDINFGGNDFDQKIGGECIVYDKNDPAVLFAGGRRSNEADSTSWAQIYQSTNGGDNWTDINDEGVRGNVITIIVNPVNSDEIWVGTDKGVYMGSFNSGKSQWEWTLKKSNVYLTVPAYRLVMDPTGSYIYLGQGPYLLISTNSGTSWPDKTSGFDNSINPTSKITNIVYNESTDELFVSRMRRPAKISTDNGDTWSNEISFDLDPAYTPLHALSGKSQIFDGRSSFSYGPGGYYSSGGAGPYMSTTVDWIDDDWRYFTDGMSMTVVYDVAIDPYNNKGNYNIYIPLSDWSMGRTQNEEYMPEMYDYSRNGTHISGDDSYITNVTRALIYPNATSTAILIGGSVYSPHYAAMTKMELSTSDVTGGTTYTKLENNGLPLYSEAQRTLIDGIIAYNSTSSLNNIVVLVGGGEVKTQIEGTGDKKGIYYSTNGGANFTKSTIIGTYSDYGNAFVGDVFSSQFNLANHPSNVAIKYAYLENGGMFKSTTDGATWSRISEVVQNPGTEYKDEGCLKVIDNSGNPEFYLAVKNRGLYKSTNGGVNWSNMSGWVSATQVEVTSTRMYAFGKRTSDTYNKIYLSTNSGSTWNCITDGFESTIGTIPSTRGLRHDIHEDKIFICTGGQGVFVYTPGSSEEDGDHSRLMSDIKYNLLGNFPNPFNPTTKIKYSIGKDSFVKVTVFDILGREIKTLTDEFQKTGFYEVRFDGGNLSSGIFYYRIQAGDFVETRRMVLMK